MDTMYFSWQELPVEIDPGVQLPQFVLEGKILYDCSQNYTAGRSVSQSQFIIVSQFTFLSRRSVVSSQRSKFATNSKIVAENN